MKHAFIMDALDKVKPWKDTTYFLMRACAERGHQVCHLDQRALWLQHDEVYATVDWLEVNAYDQQKSESPFQHLHTERIALSQSDVVWIRTDPPFDRRYFYTTLLLDQLPPSTRIVNRPAALRGWNEKLAALDFPEYTPPTVVTNDRERIVNFAREQGRITLKPVDGFGGKGIVFFHADDDPRAVIDATHNGRHWVIAQAYLPQARDGDKRVLLLNGEILGGILRLHADGADLNNLDAGGTAHPLELTARDREICAAIKPALIQRGVFFAGIDIIGDYLIEVNVTSPTGLQELCRFNGEDFHHQIIAALEK
ncbi:MAG: glutathione synthase [bacterium]